MQMAGVHSPTPPQQQQHYAPPLPPPQYAAYLSPEQQQLYQQAASHVRPGTLPPGVCVKIGEHEVTIERFLSEGGFAHVYQVRSSRPIPSPIGSAQTSEYEHVLKRVAVPDKETLKDVRWEVDVMKLVRGHKHIVNLIEASAAPIPGTTGYEVFILMERCSGGGIIDMMNTRLQNRLTEPEILKIFSDVVEAVCWMHTRNPPLIHRDLKVENILLAGPEFYKLCDFGSASTPKRAPQTMQEIQALEADLNKNTTLQYRAPEMCDVWARKEVGLAADVWALGVLLYKLCFYTTPFEEQGPLAILNVQYKMPSYPNYSQDIRKLIASMLVEPIAQRPTAWQIHQQVCRLRGVRPHKEYQMIATSATQSPGATSLNGAVSPSFASRPGSSTHNNVAPQKSGQEAGASLPSTMSAQNQLGVSPMRRGRPTKSGESGHASTFSTSSSHLSSEWQPHLSNPMSAPHHSSSLPAPSSSSALPHSNSTISLPAQSQDIGSPGHTGFADSFVPSIQLSPGSASTSPLPDSNDTGQKAHEAAVTAVWQEQSSPGSSKRPPDTLASLAAARSGNGADAAAASAPPSVQPKPRIQQYMQQFQQPPPSNAGSKPSSSSTPSDLRRVSPGKPLGPRPALPPTPGATASQSQSQSNISSFASAVPTRGKSEGTQTSSPKLVNLPPVKAPKPNLVSRASQTSPTLLNQWLQKEQGRLMPTQQQQQRDQPPTRSPSFGQQNSVTESMASSSTEGESGGREIERFPSIDDWEATSFSPPSESTPASVLSPETTSLASISTTQQQSRVDLLDDDPDGMGGLPPSRKITGLSAISSLSSASALQKESSSSSLRSSITGDDKLAQSAHLSPRQPIRTLSGTSSSSQSTSNGQRLTLPSNVDTSSSSEDDELNEPEHATGEHYGHLHDGLDADTAGNDAQSLSSPPMAVPTSLPSHLQQSPGRGPPILSPKPKLGGTSSIVSRYENISASDPVPDARQQSSSTTGNSSGSARQGSLGPAKPPKPSDAGARLRAGSSGAQPRAVTNSTLDEDFNTRFPHVGEDKRNTSSTGTSVASQEPYNLQPSRDHPGVSTNSQTTKPSQSHFQGRQRPQSMHLPATSGNTKQPHGANHGPPVPEEGEDEEYQGVSNLRDRWMKKIHDTLPHHHNSHSNQGQQEDNGTPLNRRASTLASNRWIRQ